MHMNRRGWHTAEALPEIIAGLRAKGFVLSQVGSMVQSAHANAQ
jgi:peptidoglycan/xylan/chitin deacetylase (PgdA/CDA1 family)